MRCARLFSQLRTPHTVVRTYSYASLARRPLAASASAASTNLSPGEINNAHRSFHSTTLQQQPLPLFLPAIAAVLKALRTNTAFFQREVAKRLGLKFAPKLQFRADESFEEADRIERLLNDPKVARDLDGDEE